MIDSVEWAPIYEKVLLFHLSNRWLKRSRLHKRVATSGKCTWNAPFERIQKKIPRLKCRRSIVSACTLADVSTFAHSRASIDAHGRLAQFHSELNLERPALWDQHLGLRRSQSTSPTQRLFLSARRCTRRHTLYKIYNQQGVALVWCKWLRFPKTKITLVGLHLPTSKDRSSPAYLLNFK